PNAPNPPSPQVPTNPGTGGQNPGGGEQPDPALPDASKTTVAVQNVGDYTVDYIVHVKNSAGNGITGLTKEDFNVMVGQEVAANDVQFDVTQQNSGQYHLSIYFNVIDDALEGKTFKPFLGVKGVNLQQQVPEATVKAPVLDFIQSQDKMTYSVNLRNFSNVKGVQIHVLHNEYLYPE